MSEYQKRKKRVTIARIILAIVFVVVIGGVFLVVANRDRIGLSENAVKMMEPIMVGIFLVFSSIVTLIERRNKPKATPEQTKELRERVLADYDKQAIERQIKRRHLDAIAQCREEENNPGEIEAIEKYLEYKTNDDKYYDRLAELYAMQGDTGNAARCFRKLMMLRPKDPLPYLRAAKMYYDDEKYVTAKTYITNLIDTIPEDDPNYANTYAFCSILCKKTDDPDGAREMLEIACSAGFDDSVLQEG